MNREIFVLSGPNGAGKSTTATVLLPERLGIDHFVNADVIAQGMSPFAPEKSAFLAARFMLARIHQLRDRGDSFAFETTLATRSYKRFLCDARTYGYINHVVYIYLSSVELALSRVAARVRQGGHGVPAETVQRRYWRGLRNFFDLYQPLADSWALCDNSSEELVVIARGRLGVSPTVFEPDTLDRIQRQASHEGP